MGFFCVLPISLKFKKKVSSCFGELDTVYCLVLSADASSLPTTLFLQPMYESCVLHLLVCSIVHLTAKPVWPKSRQRYPPTRGPCGRHPPTGSKIRLASLLVVPNGQQMKRKTDQMMSRRRKQHLPRDCGKIWSLIGKQFIRSVKYSMIRPWKEVGILRN